MLNRSTSLAISTSVLKAMPGKLDINRHSSSILNISASLLMSTSVLDALLSKLDMKRHLPSILYISLFSTLLFFTKTGYVYDLAEYIADIVNIEYQLVPTTEYGEWNEENETWSGMVGQLYERVI